jgi:tetratricopeptide (TPR) repeat protein
VTDDADATQDLDDAEREVLARALKPDRAAGIRTRQARAAAKAALFDAPGQVTKVDRYLILGLLGSGAMGTVFEAYDPKLNRKVALKVLVADPPPSGATIAPDGARGVLVREAEALAQVRHPNVVQVYDAGLFEEDQVFLTMELIAGETLRAWLERGTNRDWHTTLSMLMQAGRGLAAVHAAGLVHRDFKPDNVLIGNDGVARVADFGLARADVGEAADALETTAGAAGSRRTTAAGTPAYLAPERVLGISASARSDQFSFCVAAFEGLAGRRPYSNIAVLAGDFTEDACAMLPAELPSWLGRVLRRGLDRDPEARHDSMGALLAELEAGLATDERRRKRRASLKRSAFAVSLVGMLAAFAYGASRIDRSARVARCEADAAGLDALWPGRAQDVSGGVAGSGLSFAADTVGKLTPLLDAWADEWSTTLRQACIDATVEHTLPADSFARAAGCLDLRRAEVETLLDLLASGDPRAIEHAVTSVAGLQPAHVCADRRSLEHGSWPAADQWDEVLETRRVLAMAASLEWSGNYDRAREIAGAALTRAEALGWAPLVARARLQIGSLESAAGNHEVAHARLEEAFFSARRAGADDVAAAAATQLVSVVGVRLARSEAGLQWGKHAQVLLDEVEAGPRLRASLDRAHGAIHVTAFDLDEATASYLRAVERLEQSFGPEHPDVATSLGALATVHRKRGDYPEAKSIQARVLALTQRGLGPNHPAVSDALNNLAAAHLGAGETEQAGTLLERSIAILEAAFGPDHPGLASILDNLAKVREAAGKLDEAQALYERSLRISEQSLGVDHPRLGRTLSDLGALLATRGDLEAARESFERAHAVVEKAYGPEHPDAASILSNLATLHQWAGNLEQAFDMQRSALLATEKKLGADHILLAGPLYNLGSLSLDLKRPQDAVSYLERCVEIMRAHEGEQEYEGSALYMLARSLIDAGGDEQRALELAREAQARFASKPPPDPADRERLEQLLARYER